MLLSTQTLSTKVRLRDEKKKLVLGRNSCKYTVNFRYPINTFVTDVCLIYQDFFYHCKFFETFHRLSTRVQNPAGKVK